MPDPAELTTAAVAVLTGGDPAVVAQQHRLDPAMLDDAVATYHRAGLTELHRQAENSWYQVNIQFADQRTAEKVGATVVGPVLDGLQADGDIAAWWFLRKPPGWRLRLLHADTAAVNDALDQLDVTGAIGRWWPTVYEPELAAFGGTASMDTIHALFCADSAGILDYLRHDRPVLRRKELSLVLLNGLLRSAGLDTFECGDVFNRVAELRPTPASTELTRIDTLANDIRPVLSIPDQVGTMLFAASGPAVHAAQWNSALRAAGEQLGQDAAHGHLHRGLRAVLTHVVIFHWNRLGIPATNQSILARAATLALLPSN